MEADRVRSLQHLRANNINPYNNEFVPTLLALPNDAINKPFLNEIASNSLSFKITGRVIQINNMGGSKFIFIKRDNHISQVFIQKKVPEAFELSKSIQLGDIIGAEGPMFRTNQDKIALKVDKLVLLTKALRGAGKILQEGNEIHNKELLYRQRYLDMMMNPEVLDTFKKRSEIIRTIRDFFYTKRFIEVETRTLVHTNGGANAQPFTTRHNALDIPMYLRIAPELDLKRLMVGGMDRIFEIGKNFRNEGMDKDHNPEFTSLEAYMAYATWEDMMNLIQELLIQYMENIKRVPIDSLLYRHLGYHVPAEHMGEALDKISHLIIEPTFVMFFPIAISPLARSHDTNPNFAQRFEFYWKGMEIANGFSELNDPIEQHQRFLDQETKKKDGDHEAMEMDHDYIRALEYGMPPTAGVGIGIDRLVMLLLGKDNIREVIPFPQYRPEAQ